MSLRRTLSAFALAAAVGCTSARMVSQDPAGGVVAIPKNTDHWPTRYRRDAEELMRERCPEGYVIDHEGEAVVGHTTTENRTGNDNSLASVVFGVGAETRTSQTVDVKEWRIHFHSRNAVPAVAAAPVATPPPAAAVVPASATLPAEPVPVAAP